MGSIYKIISIKEEPLRLLSFNDEEICSCECHIKGTMIMHCFPCCNTSVQYINQDGTLDIDLYKSIIKK